MDPVKLEVDRYLCQGCLSGDRNVVTLKENIELFLLLLGIEQIKMKSELYNIVLCWECMGLLRKIYRFQKMIRRAQNCLQELYNSSQPILSLSSLTVVTTNEQIQLKHEKRVSETEHEIKEEGRINDIKSDQFAIANDILKEEVDLNLEDNFSDPDYEYPELKLEIKKETTKKESIKKIEKKKKYSSKVSENRAKITVNPNVDLSNAEKYFKIEYLSENEMEDLVKKENDGEKINVRHTCKVCRSTFKTTVDKKRHIMFVHIVKIDGPYKCLECGTEVADLLSLKEHWKKHNFVFRCQLCLMGVRYPSDMKKHLTQHARLFTCRLCDATVNSVAAFSKHKKEYHSKAICDYCGKVTKSRRAMENHIRNNHTSTYCVHCSRTFASPRALRTHTKLRDGPGGECAYCVECDRQFPNAVQYKRHLATAAAHRPRVRLRIPCPECGKIFSRKSYMMNHYRQVHDGRSKHYCQICDKYFSTGYAARKHKQFVHDKIKEPKTKICDICGRAFMTNRILANHRRTHTGERPFQCAACGASFAQRAALVSHLRSQHRRGPIAPPTGRGPIDPPTGDPPTAL